MLKSFCFHAFVKMVQFSQEIAHISNPKQLKPFFGVKMDQEVFNDLHIFLYFSLYSMQECLMWERRDGQKKR